jgi:hypothetical protein
VESQQEKKTKTILQVILLLVLKVKLGHMLGRGSGSSLKPKGSPSSIVFFQSRQLAHIWRSESWLDPSQSLSAATPSSKLNFPF